jgi:hypothetical protein
MPLVVLVVVEIGAVEWPLAEQAAMAAVLARTRIEERAVRRRWSIVVVLTWAGHRGAPLSVGEQTTFTLVSPCARFWDGAPAPIDTERRVVRRR